MDPQTQTAPPVVAVVVTRDAGPWFEQCLQALAAQDYPNLEVLVVDAGSLTDPTSRIAAVLPTAYVRRMPGPTGYAEASNDVLGVVEGASLYLFCHDDVAPDPDAVRLLVEEAFRSNAGIVTPKYVQWDAPERLLQVGMGADKFGAPVPSVERGELDQAQHDGVRDVSVAPGGCTLVRADLFATLGGFDAAIDLYGEDLDLSWRAQLAGARVVASPAARVRHLEAATRGLRSPAGRQPTAREVRDQVRRLQLRHRLRTVLKVYSRLQLLRIVPQLVLLHVLEVGYGLIAGRTATVRAILAGWRWNLGRMSELRAARKQGRAARHEPDAAVRRLQARGSARLTAFVRGQLAGEDRARLLTGDGAVVATLRDARLPLLVWGGVALALVVGGRHLLFGDITAIGDLAPIPGPVELGREMLSGWRLSGLGSESPAPAAFGLLGLASAALLGGSGLLLKLLVLGCAPVGIVGAFRMARPLGSLPSRLAAVVIYTANPLWFDAVAEGRWGGLAGYAVAPWVLLAAGRLGRLHPFDNGAGGARRVVLGLGLLLAAAAALAPAVLVVVAVVAAALLLGILLAGGTAGALRAASSLLLALVIAAVLLFPWSLEAVLPGAEWSSIVGVARASDAGLSLGRLLRFDLGPLPSGPFGWTFAIAAALPLLIGRSWRLAWALRSWAVALTCIGLAWAGGRGWVPIVLPPAEVLLAPAAAALALSTALGLRAFELDLPRYRFGWRQGVSLAAAAAVGLACIPVLVTLPDGAWRQPDQSLADVLRFLPSGDDGGYRILWVGDPEVLPLQGWQLDEGVAYATSRDGMPTASELWPPSSDGATGLLADALRVARRGETSRIGHLLAPMAVRYVVVTRRAAPAAEGTREHPLPPDLTSALADQVDLKPIPGDRAVTVYENQAWAPSRAQLSGAAVEASSQGELGSALGAELAGSPAVLPGRGPFRFRGPVRSGAALHAEAASSRWRLEVNGRPAPARRAFGWATSYNIATGGTAELRYRTSLYRYVALTVELVLWIVVIRTYRRLRPEEDE